MLLFEKSAIHGEDAHRIHGLRQEGRIYKLKFDGKFTF